MAGGEVNVGVPRERSAALLSSASQEIPEVAPGVPECADTAIGLIADRADQLAARVQDASNGAVEVLDAKEQPDPASELATDEGSLPVTVGAGEHEAGAAFGRSYHDPPFRAPVGRLGRGVFRQHEPQRTGEELDGGVVVVDDQRYELEGHPADARSAAPDAVGIHTSRWPVVESRCWRGARRFDARGRNAEV